MTLHPLISHIQMAPAKYQIQIYKQVFWLRSSLKDSIWIQPLLIRKYVSILIWMTHIKSAA